MNKVTPPILVTILALTAVILSVQSKQAPAPSAPLAVKETAVAEKQAPPKPAEAAAKVTPRPWPQAGSDIAPDPVAVYGTLDNGMRYVIYPNSEPPKRVSLRLHIATGSLMEKEEQRGLAHFMEHMVFNGTKHFKADDLVPRMQRLGIGFGAHVNAHTSFDETVYMLDLPDLSEQTLDLGFTVMRDFGDGANLDPSEIDRERGVILSEKVSRDSVGTRLMEQEFKEILPGSLVPLRFPIGIENVIKSSQRDRFVDYYSHYYTPQRMTFVVVGDVKPEAFRARIEAAFSSMVNPDKLGPDPDLGKLHVPEGLETHVFSDKEVASTEVSLFQVKPYVEKPDTTATRAEEMPLELAHAIISRRLERISKEKNSPVAEGGVSHEPIFNYAELGNISIVAADDRWQEVVPILEKEFRRALQYGFTDTELAEAKANVINSFEQAVKQKATRKSEKIAGELLKSINDKDVFSDPEIDLALAKRCLDATTAETCLKALKQYWDAPGFHLVLTTKEKPANAEKDLAALFEDSRGKPVEAPAARAIQVFSYNDFGKPGIVASRAEVADLGITQLVLSNNIRVNLKHTDFEKGKVHLLARIGSGKLSQPKDSPMLDYLAEMLFDTGGLGKYSNDDLQQILAGKNVKSSLGIEEGAFVLNGVTTPPDFTLQCQYMCASLTDPGYRQDALWQYQKAVPMLVQQLKHTPAGPQKEMEGWLHGGDPRYIVAPEAKLASYSIDDAKKWLTPELTKGYMELTIVGDFELDKILPDLLGTFGALSERAASAPALPDARKVKLPNAPAAKVFTYDSKIPQAVAISLWKTAGYRENPREFRRLNILAEILTDRLREEIRQKLGVSYSPSAGATGSDVLEGYGLVLSESIGKPDDLEKLLNSMREQADNIATKGASADELDRALKPTFSQLDKSLRDNKYWIATVLSQSQSDPNRLELARHRDEDYHSINLAEINALAKKYLTADRAMFVSIKPGEPVKGAEEKTTPEKASPVEPPMPEPGDNSQKPKDTKPKKAKHPVKSLPLAQ